MIKFTDDKFLAQFVSDCSTSRVGATARMIYYLGLALLPRLDNIIELLKKK